MPQQQIDAEAASQKSLKISKIENQKPELLKAAVDSFVSFISQISHDDNIDISERITTIQMIIETAAFELENLEPSIPKQAPHLWIERENKSENPFIFAHRIYGDAVSIMVLSDFTKLDKPLGTILERYRREERHIPEGLDIQTKKERDQHLKENPQTWGELIAKLPPALQREFRAFKAAEKRRS